MTAISTIALETGQIEGIPTLTCIPRQQEPCPVVFFIPGFWGNKSSALSLAYPLARRGIACISLDPLYHGDRYDPRSQRAAEPAFGASILLTPAWILALSSFRSFANAAWTSKLSWQPWPTTPGSISAAPGSPASPWAAMPASWPWPKSRP